MGEPHHCPRCGRMTEGPQARSRADSTREVCPLCGQHEAMLVRDGKQLPPPSAWPVRYETEITHLLAECSKCGERFVPADEEDTVHLVRDDGTECGGQGHITSVFSVIKKEGK